MSLEQQKDINPVPQPTPEAVAAPKLPTNERSLLRKIYDNPFLRKVTKNFPQLAALPGLALFPGVARANTEITQEKPNVPQIEVTMDGLPAFDAQTPPGEAVAGAVDLVEPAMEPAPAPEVPANVEAKPIYSSPNGVLTAEDQPDWQTKIRFTGEKIKEYEDELSKTGVKFEFVPDNTLTLDLADGTVDKGKAISYNSCLGIGISRQGAMGCYDSPWLIYQADYDTKPGVILVHYKEFTDPSIKPDDRAYERLTSNLNAPLISIWAAHALNLDVNSSFSRNLSGTLSTLPGIVAVR